MGGVLGGLAVLAVVAVVAVFVVAKMSPTVAAGMHHSVCVRVCGFMSVHACVCICVCVCLRSLECTFACA